MPGRGEVWLVDIRNKAECAAFMFFFPASSRYGNGSCANSRNIIAATPLSNWPLPSNNGTAWQSHNRIRNGPQKPQMDADKGITILPLPSA